MSYTVNIDNFDSSYWQEQAKEFADYSLYQTWPYQENRAQMDSCSLSRAVVTDENGQVCLMCQVRIKEVKALGLKVGYVQWGPLVRGKDDQLKCSVDALVELKNAYVENMVNVLRVVPNMPAHAVGSEFCQLLKSAGFKHSSKSARYRTIAINFDNGEEGIRKGMSQNYRRGLKKTENSQLEIRRQDDGEGFSVFSEMYSDLQQAKGFGGLHMDEFSNPQQMLSDDEKLSLLLLYNEDRPISGILSTNLGDSGMLLLAVSNEEGRKLKGAYPTWFASVMLALESGKIRYDLGGIDPEKNPGVYNFKSRMGGAELYYVGAYDAFSSTTVKAIWAVSDTVRNFLKFRS